MQRFLDPLFQNFTQNSPHLTTFAVHINQITQNNSLKWPWNLNHSNTDPISHTKHRIQRKINEIRKKRRRLHFSYQEISSNKYFNLINNNQEKNCKHLVVISKLIRNEEQQETSEREKEIWFYFSWNYN